MIFFPNIGKKDGGLLPNPSPPYDRVSEILLLLQIIGATFLQKIAVPLGGGADYFFQFFWMFGITIYAVVSNRLELNNTRFIVVSILISGLCLSQLIGNSEPSLLSLTTLLMIHLHYMFGLKSGSTRPGIELIYFQKIMLIIGVLGIFQYFLQFIIGMNWAYFMDTIFPKSFYKRGFNGLNEVAYGSTTLKSNGIFFLEPSILSQFMAIAIIIELLYFKNIRRLLIYILTIAVTFSGTGLVILFALMPFLLLKQKKFLIFFTLGILFVTAPVWAPYVGLGTQIERAAEITNERSSGYARFISMVPFIGENIVKEANTFLFGRGAGSMPWDGGLLSEVDYEIFNPSWAKLFFEYGFIGSFFYVFFMFFILKKSRQSAFVKIALLIQFVLLGEFIIPPTVHAIIIALLIWPSPESIDKFNQLIGKEEKKLSW